VGAGHILAARIVTWIVWGTAILTLLAIPWAARDLGLDRSVSNGIRRHPQWACFALFMGLTILETWPLATDPARLSRNDSADTVLNEWILSWVVHQAPRDPFHLFDCCLVSNGGLCVIVTGAERARSLRRPPVYLLGMAQGHLGGDPADTLASGAVRWQAAVPSDPRYAATETELFEIQGDQVVALWGVASAQHLVAFGAKDGARRWETTLPKARFELPARFVTLSAARVYVPRSSRLEVLDRRTGALLGGIGPL
jgi:hypothetical protein